MSRRSLFIAMLVAVGGLMLSGCVEGGYYYDSYDAYPYYDYGYGGPFIYQDVYVHNRHHGRRYYSRRYSYRSRHFDRNGSRHFDRHGSRHFDRHGSVHFYRNSSFQGGNRPHPTRGSDGRGGRGSRIYIH